MNQYVICFEPTLEVDVQMFAEIWNQHATERTLAQANVLNEVSRDASLISDAMLVLSGITIGLVTNALYDMIKQVVVSASKQGNVKNCKLEVYEVTSQEGTTTLVIRCKKE